MWGGGWSSWDSEFTRWDHTQPICCTLALCPVGHQVTLLSGHDPEWAWDKDLSCEWIVQLPSAFHRQGNWGSWLVSALRYKPQSPTATEILELTAGLESHPTLTSVQGGLGHGTGIRSQAFWAPAAASFVSSSLCSYCLVLGGLVYVLLPLCVLPLRRTMSALLSQ